jgi:hypothetical protein
MMLDVFLATSPADAARLAPASITVLWQDCPVEEVRQYLAAAVRLTEMVNRRLDRLQAAADKAAVWNANPGLEYEWFGGFSEHKFHKVRMTFQAIQRLLKSPRLKVVCGDMKAGDAFGMSLPILFPHKIWLGRVWRFAYPRGYDFVYPDRHDYAERVGTFVHEAAHLCGRFSLYEYKPQGSGVGPNAALLLAARGMRATENADNYGYYALDVVRQACRL